MKLVPIPMKSEAAPAMKKIEILGTGCPKCRALEQSAKVAVARLGIEAEVVKGDKLEEILQRGVMMTPALAIDGVVKSSGRALSVEQIGALLGGGTPR